MENYLRCALPVKAEQYKPGKGLEDGFELWSKVITNGWINQDNLVQITNDDGTIVCPFIINKRGRIFIRQGDYIILETDYEKHVCGDEKFHIRFTKADHPEN